MLRFRLAVVSVLILSSVPALASVVQPLTDREMVERADIVMAGIVVATEVKRTPMGRVYTEAAVQVMQAVKGVKVGDVFYVRTPGGVVGNVVHDVAGAPKPVVGDKVVGFVEKRGDSGVPLGLSFGWLRVHDIDGVAKVFRDLGGLALADGQGDVDATKYVVAGVPLDTYLQKLRGFVRPAAPGAGEVLP